MRQIRCLFLLILNILFFTDAKSQNNAAPSMHIYYYFPSEDAILKMQKIKIVKSADASYFEVNKFTNGYTGLQQTPSKSYITPNIFISSLWDSNTAEGIFSEVNYYDSSTKISRFGGEGDGWKTINPYNWQLNTWYNIVNRAWKSGGRLYIATFINDTSTGKWFHTATFSIPEPNRYLKATNDAFLENWDSQNSTMDGRFVRQAFFKDCWNLNLNGEWEKNTNAYFKANNSEADLKRNGKFHNSFNAFFDETEDAYCMIHGGDTKPSEDFQQGERTLKLPAQPHQGEKPTLTVGSITSLYTIYKNGIIEFYWTIDPLKSPQLSTNIEVIDSKGLVLISIGNTAPEERTFTLNQHLKKGNYTIKIEAKDIFNQNMEPKTFKLKVK